MQLLTQTTLLLLFCTFLVQALSFHLFDGIKNFFSRDKKKIDSDGPVTEAAKFQTKAEKMFAEFMGKNKNTVYETAHVYQSASRKGEIIMDVLLHRTLAATGETRAYPFDFLLCNDVKLVYRDTTKRFDVTHFNCSDLGPVPKGLDKEIVAQAARSYVSLRYPGQKYSLLRVNKVVTDGPIHLGKKNKVTVTLLMDLQMVKPEELLKARPKSSKVCRAIMLKYSGRPSKWTSHKFVKIQSEGNCSKTELALFDPQAVI